MDLDRDAPQDLKTIKKNKKQSVFCVLHVYCDMKHVLIKHFSNKMNGRRYKCFNIIRVLSDHSNSKIINLEKAECTGESPILHLRCYIR